MSQPRLTLQDLYDGNQRFMHGNEPSNIDRHVRIDKQEPPFLLFNCADSRLPGSLVFSVPLGNIFSSANIANQFNEQDLNTKSVLSFAVDNLKVDHIIVMGHYGCGGVAAAIASPPKGDISAAGITIHEYIAPIRRIYQTTERPEIASYREAKAPIPVEDPANEDHDYRFIAYSRDPALYSTARALVEENVRAQVARIATSELMTEKFNSPDLSATGVFIHGFVYELETGQVYDLGVSVGRPGIVPHMPFPRAP
ncbi:carbonic anhydrase [Collybia nuda]|uniref:Carbonic anhydrase n=1 Tax=Collybia nuda TaxID=64659 RepID=A0A9P5Y9X6_9AGAR|nr:carbonic anhydrase [Collybia nuda]